MGDFNDVKFEEIKTRVFNNTHTRNDVLALVEMVDNFEKELDDLEDYILEEMSLNSEDEE
jgi:hypothetical protein